eukprot:TRINITY_DN8392_c0_g1_i15.p2 TRINITY_DN8392_c0_g1~~TRINITY_DN8392_c0_g1_i15.p2  ORF type:complete len:202 (+),score=72.18 TRINITY_DN8392_c0_g1_i15:260-865(+)
MDQQPVYDYLIKLILIGDSGVGKTCFLMRFAEDTFITNYISTIGIDFKVKPVKVDGKMIKLQIWDTAGQDRFRTITQTYYKGAMGVILAYDCTDEASFNNVKNWVKQLETHANPEIVKVLVGNKSDCTDKKVSAAKGKELAKEYGMTFFETSAKDNININEVFYYLAKAVKDKLSFKEESSSVKLRNDKGKKTGKFKGRCC